ncbi:hypothetical protein [Thermoclostridium stercorarium]|jgi:hypothetical protein|nr:hypothetical protein [Thermoclostridium stercorarium]
MIDKETGKIVIKDDLVIYPGMTKEEFIKSKLFNEDADNGQSGKIVPV